MQRELLSASNTEYRRKQRSTLSDRFMRTMSTDISDERKAEIVDAYVLLRKSGADEQEAIDTVCREYSLDEITLKDLVKQISGEKDIL
jgi:hypothetical protein